MKFGPKSKLDMMRMWCEFRLIRHFVDFSIFLPFWQFVGIFDGVLESKVCRKAHGWVRHIFIFVSMYFEPILGTRARQKGLISTRHFGFGSKCSLKGRKGLPDPLGEPSKA